MSKGEKQKQRNRKREKNAEKDALEILDSEFLKKRDYNLKYSDERLEIVKGLDKNKTIQEHLSSKQFRLSQVKKKKDKLSEHDSFCKKLDSLAYYILKSEFKNKEHEKEFEEDEFGTVLNNNGENNLAYKRDYKINEADRIYGYPVMSVYAMNQNRKGSPNNRKREVFILTELKKRFGKNNNITEEEAHDILKGYSDEKHSANNENAYERIIYSLREPKNVLVYLRHEEEVLALNDNDPASEFYLIAHVLEDIYKDLGFQTRERYIIQCLKDGMTYEEVSTCVSKEFNEPFSFGRTRSEIESILCRIADDIKEKIAKII